MLNGGRPAAFIVDTGGEVISLNADVADSLALRPARRIPLRVYGLEGLDSSAFLLPGVDLDVASIALRQIGVAVLDLRSPSVLLGFQIGGIVGTSSWPIGGCLLIWPAASCVSARRPRRLDDSKPDPNVHFGGRS